MGLAVPALMLVESDPARAVVLQLGVLFLMATHSTFFSPAKYGILPEAVPPSELSRANGLLEMSTFAAIILGTSVGGELFERWSDEPWLPGRRRSWRSPSSALRRASASRSVRAARPGQPLRLEPVRRNRPRPRAPLAGQDALDHDDRHLVLLAARHAPPAGAAALGPGDVRVGEAAATRLYTFLAIGIGAGSLLAGRLSGDKVELGLVPLGSIGLGVFSLLLLAGAVQLLARRRRPRAPRHCRRLLRRAAQRAAPAAAGR